MTATDPGPGLAAMLAERLAPAAKAYAEDMSAGPAPACPNRLQHMNPAHGKHDIS